MPHGMISKKSPRIHCLFPLTAAVVMAAVVVVVIVAVIVTGAAVAVTAATSLTHLLQRGRITLTMQQRAQDK